VILCDFREALDIQYDLVKILADLEEQEQFPKISVELVDKGPSAVYAVSKKAAQVCPVLPAGSRPYDEPLLRIVFAFSLTARSQHTHI